ncbi:hypothetical protein F7725_009144 [Dissostichus mawsoni]|uniref:Uncharacterized protein n=1 Tax=Dissostichus mawsoni TaxID=36200 RepID=A0A7J5Z6A9_DISMA|nr:hypothetical protein F7725_009144 [Dissostichus mawsoni]
MPRRDRIRKEKQRELQQAARGSSSLLSWVKQPEPTSKEDEDADVPDEPLPIINDEDEEERQLQQAQGSSPLLSCNSPSMSMEDEGDKSIENISESDTDEAEMSESRAAPCSETVLSDDDQNEGEMEGESSIDEESQEPTVREQDKTIAKIAIMQYPTDPSHVEVFNIKCNDSYISMCCSVGPCQADMAYPKNTEGRSFQKQWFSGNAWLEYSPTADSMHCFSCRLFHLKSTKVEQHGRLMA